VNTVLQDHEYILVRIHAKQKTKGPVIYTGHASEPEDSELDQYRSNMLVFSLSSISVASEFCTFCNLFMSASVMPQNTALPKSSRDITMAWTSVLRASVERQCLIFETA